MTAPVQEPSQGRTDAGQQWAVRQLFRRPAPTPAPAASMDPGYEYRWGAWDNGGLGFLAYQDDDTPAANQCMDGASVACLQGQGDNNPVDITPPPRGIGSRSPIGSFISGHCAYRVTDLGVFSGVTEFMLYPTWTNDAQGTGPYIDFNLTDVPPGQAAKAGQGTVWDFANLVGYPFDLWTDGHSRFICRMVADGSLITATNPITFAEGDGIQAFWTCFVHGWD